MICPLDSQCLLPFPGSEIVGKADREKLPENRVGLVRERYFSSSFLCLSLPAIFCPHALSLLSHLSRSSALTESLTQASLFLNHCWKKLLAQITSRGVAIIVNGPQG